MLFRGCLGSVGLLKEWLERALFSALSDERSVITLTDLESGRIHGGKLETILDEQERGLEEIRLLRGNDAELERKLGMASLKPKSTRIALLPPGTRTLKRDPVPGGAVA